MGACASKKAYQSAALKDELAGAGPSRSHPGYGVPVGMRGSTTDAGKRSTADVITTAFLAQADAGPESVKGIAARLAVRLGTEGRRASAQSAHLGIGPAPAAESRADLASYSPSHAKESSARGALAGVCPPQDSFEMSREETMQRLNVLQKSFKDGSPTPAWAFATRKPSADATDAAEVIGSDDFDGRSSTHSEGRSSAGGRRTSNGSGGGGIGRRWSVGGMGSPREGEAEDALSKVVEEQEDVVPVDEDVGTGQEKSAAAAAAGAAAAGRAAGAAASDKRKSASQDGAGAWDGADPSLLLGREGSSRREACTTPRRNDGPFRTISVAKMQGPGPAQGAAGTAAERGAGGPAAATGTAELQGETDELASLPLPNLISRADKKRANNTSGAGGAVGGAAAPGRAARAATGQRYSAASYLQQAAMEPVVSTPSSGGGAGRNSDLGYYLEEARLTSAVMQGAAPVRHNLNDSPLVRLKEEAAAREAEQANKAPIVLDYVPSIKSQPSRSNLLMASPSVHKSRQLLQSSGGGGGSPFDDLDDDCDLSASRRLDYTPNRTLSRKFSHANLMPSGSVLLAASSCSRPVSRVNSRSNLACSSPRGMDGFPGSPRGTGADGTGSDRCFHVTRTAASIAAGAAGLVSSSYLVVPSPAPGPALASPVLGARRRRGGGDGLDSRISTSGSQVHFGPIPAAVAVAASPGTPTAAALRSAASQELSWRPARAAVAPFPEQRSSTPQLLVSPTPQQSRLHIRSSVLNDPGSRDTSGSRRPSTMHEVLGSSVWTGRGPAASAASAVSMSGASAPAPLAAPALSASNVSRRGLGSTDLGQADVGGGGGGVGDIQLLSSFSVGAGNGARAGRAARLLATLQRMGAGATEAAAAQ